MIQDTVFKIADCILCYKHSIALKAGFVIVEGEVGVIFIGIERYNPMIFISWVDNVNWAAWNWRCERHALVPRSLAFPIGSDDGLPLVTSALENPCGGQFKLSIHFIEPNYLVILHTDAAP